MYDIISGACKSKLKHQTSSYYAASGSDLVFGSGSSLGACDLNFKATEITLLGDAVVLEDAGTTDGTRFSLLILDFILSFNEQ